MVLRKRNITPNIPAVMIKQIVIIYRAFYPSKA